MLTEYGIGHPCFVQPMTRGCKSGMVWSRSSESQWVTCARTCRSPFGGLLRIFAVAAMLGRVPCRPQGGRATHLGREHDLLQIATHAEVLVTGAGENRDAQDRISLEPVPGGQSRAHVGQAVAGLRSV